MHVLEGGAQGQTFLVQKGETEMVLKVYSDYGQNSFKAERYIYTKLKTTQNLTKGFAYLYSSKQRNDRYELLIEAMGPNLLEDQKTLQDGHFPPFRVLRIIMQLTEALRVLHEQNWTHGDLKLQNILLNK